LPADNTWSSPRRGVFQIDPAKRDISIFRGYDHDAFGGVVLRVGDKLITVSNQAVTAYPLDGGGWRLLVSAKRIEPQVAKSAKADAKEFRDLKSEI